MPLNGRRSLLLFLLFTVYSGEIYPQYFSTGQDPSRLKWEQICTENFQLIYPVHFNKEAQRVAYVLEKVYLHAGQTLQHKPSRISVLLHTQSGISNGLVAWAPKRSEFYTIPPQDIYPQDWLEQLAIHEFRHVVQIDKLNQGIARIISFLLGEQGTAAVLGIYVPLWFLEGDAVCAETGLSRSGRGRLPEFEMPLRTQLLQKKIYSYEKAFFGSYKDFVPDHYVLGYHLTALGRKKYGTELWEKTLNNVARRPYWITPFSNGIKKNSENSTKWKFYRESMQELDTLWRKQYKEISYSERTLLNTSPKKVFTSYRFPQFLNDSQIVVQKSGLAHIQQFVVLDKYGKEKRIFTPGFFSPVWLSAGANKIVWSEYYFDKRWQNRVFSDIVIYDHEREKRIRLTRRQYLFAPDISRDGKKIVAAEAAPENTFAVVVIDAVIGEELRRFSSEDMVITPRWSDDEKDIILIRMNNQGKRIEMLEVSSGKFTTLLHAGFNEISQAVKSGDYIVFHGIYSGIDNIYALHISSGEIFQITSSEFGAFDPLISSDGKTLFYAEFSAMGYNVASTDFGERKPLSEVKNNSIRLYETIALQEPGPVDFQETPPEKYEAKKYRKGAHLFNFHSWAPAYINLNDYSTGTGVTVFSQNILSTAFTSLAYQYDYNERVHGGTAEISWQAWHPVLSFSASHRDRASNLFPVTADSIIDRRYTWNETGLNFSALLPLNFTRGRYIQGMQPFIRSQLLHIRHYADTPDFVARGMAFAMSYNFSAYRFIKRAHRDVRPRWGQTLRINFRHSPGGDHYFRPMFSTQSTFLFPGLFRHHSLRLGRGYQRYFSEGYIFASDVLYPRGYYFEFNQFFSRTTVDYQFPFLYPDLRLGPFLYVQRLKLNLFYDRGEGTNEGIERIYISTGAELTVDMHIFNIFAPIDAGLRYYYHPLTGRMGAEVIFGVDF